MDTQTQAAHTSESNPVQTGGQPTGQAYTTTETTTTTHTSRTPHHSTTSTTAGPMSASGGVVGGEKKGVFQAGKEMLAQAQGKIEEKRGQFLGGVDGMAGDKQGMEKDLAIQQKGRAEAMEGTFHPTNTTAPTTSRMTDQGSMSGTGGLTGTGTGAGVGYEERVPGGSSGNSTNAAMHDASLGRTL